MNLKLSFSISSLAFLL